MHAHSRITRYCIVCGVATTKPASQFGPGRPGKYCSLRCRGLDKRTRPEALWLRVVGPNEHDCLLITGPLGSMGYGMIKVGGQSMGTHVYAYTQVCGPVPKGLFVCHHCEGWYPPGDNTYRACINPGHLYLDTPIGNNQDMWTRGRGARGARSGPTRHPESYRGENSKRAKLTEAAVREIRRMAAGGMRYTQIAEHYGISPSTVSGIARRIGWRHVE